LLPIIGAGGPPESSRAISMPGGSALSPAFSLLGFLY